MKINIEGSALFGRRSGVGQYTVRLLQGVLRQDHENSYTAFGFLLPGRHANIPNLPLRFRFIRYIPGRVYSRLLKRHLAPPIDLLVGWADLYIFPNFVRWPLAFGERSIVIVYDLSYLLHANYSDRKNRIFLTRFVPRSILRADHIITISNSAKQEIIKHYHTKPSNITVITPAVDHAVFHIQPQSKVVDITSIYNITGKYILYAGTLEPRKNIVGILNAYERLPKALRGQYQLVLAGGKGWLDQDIQRRLTELKDLKIITTGYVPDEDLPALYSGASVFVYPSHYEGFGMPPLEAMACGVPVITSNSSSLPEVVGDAGIMVDSHDTATLSRAMEQVLTSPEIHKKMQAAGLKQAQKFSWEKSAKDLIKAINNTAIL